MWNIFLAGVAPSGGEAADGEAVATLRASVSALVPFRDTVLDVSLILLVLRSFLGGHPQFFVSFCRAWWVYSAWRMLKNVLLSSPVLSGRL